MSLASVPSPRASLGRAARAVAGAAVVVATLAAPAGRAAAVTSPAADLAASAATALAEEHALVAVRAAGVDLLDAQLADADALGVELLGALQRAGVSLSGDAQAALGPLPTGGAPDDATYRAAITELVGLAGHPGRLAASNGSQTGTSLTVLVIVALMFVALGLTALLFSLRGARPQRELHALAWSDALTGLANRRRLDRDLRELADVSGTSRGRHPVSGPTAVIMVDIDHFKHINDVHGHHVGDDVLRAVGTMLTAEVRRDDVVYRYGGEEFCIVLPRTTDDDAVRVADRIVGAARRLDLSDGVRITLSAGVADGSVGDVERTLQAADGALLAAKRAGRDRATRLAPAAA